MSLLVIILAALVAISLLIFFVGITAGNQAQATNYDIDWSVLNDEEFQSYLPHKKINAIKRYRELTGLGLKEAKQAVEYIIAHPEQKKVKSGLAANTGGAGVRDLLLDNRFEEAVDVYAAFMGVDE
ncbi:MAG: ribosomal protein L7/L12, partial [Chloroflexota bacterium]